MWNPTRRNRNIGTVKQGHGNNNKLTIPWPCIVAKSYFERLESYQKLERNINGHTFWFIVETPRDLSAHACSVSDIERIVAEIPFADYGDLKLIILRQPKRKEEILSPVWGRLIYSYEFEGNYHPAIIMEATVPGKKLIWPKSLSPNEQQEFERLKVDGHQFLEGKRNYTAILTFENVRHTQLYRTLPHEFGHYVHYLETVQRPGHEDEDFEDWSKRDDDYHNIPKTEKEQYAHRYATALLEKLRSKNLIPFYR
jgi:hypothetical protein